MVKILSLILSLISCASAPIAATSGTENVTRGKLLAADEPQNSIVKMYDSDNLVFSDSSHVWNYCFREMKNKYNEMTKTSGEHSFRCVIDIHRDDSEYDLSECSYLPMEITINLNGFTFLLDYGNYWNIDHGLTINGGGGTIKTTRSSEEYNCSIFVNGGHLIVNDTHFENFHTNMKYPLFATGNNLTTASFADCTFTECSSSTYGGVICMERTKAIKIYRSTFNRCHAKYGGAVYLEDLFRDDRTIECYDCNFTKCEALHSGGAFYLYNSKESDDKNIQFSIERDSFEKCAAGYYGGAIYMDVCYGELILVQTKISECQTRSYGGAIYCHNSHSEITLGEISYCQAQYGGGIYLNALYSALYNVTVHDCIAEKDGGGIYATRGMNYSYQDGGVITDSCNFYNNTPSDGNATMMASGSLVIVFGILSGVFLISTGVFVYLYLRKRKQVSGE